ncbi:DUF6285 domain-containing protein [Variovorax sp. dw_308]|uniref:DUF6285 domain-containing protein n=1 Tax=Variovorax sp. dw_308 TaxID=2721546 RepID=UPI001C48FF86|nr:DUF6285 domain-containing protein [Variovorax sp. dw_308]
MQDPPAAAELIEAVAAFLREQVVTSTGGAAVPFHARVAANALDIVQRELSLAPEANARERVRLRALLGADMPADLAEANRLLCARIASGAMTLATPGLAEHLRQTARDKLAIDQPGYDNNDKR